MIFMEFEVFLVVVYVESDGSFSRMDILSDSEEFDFLGLVEILFFCFNLCF